MVERDVRTRAEIVCPVEEFWGARENGGFQGEVWCAFYREGLSIQGMRGTLNVFPRRLVGSVSKSTVNNWVGFGRGKISTNLNLPKRLRKLMSYLRAICIWLSDVD